MQQRFVVLDDWTDFWGGQPAVDRLRERGEVTIYVTPAASEDDVIKRVENATVVLANRERTLLPARVLRSAERLELLAQTGRISPNVDADAATERGIALVAARAAIVQQMQDKAYHDSPYAVLWYPDTLEAYRSDRFEGFNAVPTGNGSLWSTYGLGPWGSRLSVGPPAPPGAGGGGGGPPVTRPMPVE